MEIEAKFRIAKLEKVEERLRSLGAEFKGTEIEEDVYYQHPCKDFRKTDEALRVRITPSYSELTYKGPKAPIKVKAREEISVRVNDPLKTCLLLEKLGFRRVAVVKKTRKKYVLEGREISLDEVEGLGYFIEIELLSKKSLDEAEKELLEFSRKLGIREIPITKSYLELLLEKLREK
ncbi:MAG: class IV adenylate cyclase [Thermoprotei archaeon]|nr:MAG: class IV adenylate cyclase [Thermoprotei archaeon]RLF00869.1 MAG: class IV adenylate cyclase [Thermoprotei archaeon]HDI74432.1 class IV adenylate cyclase [Thermoprotei archaeon]